MTTYILLWVLVWSILAFALMGIDKWRAASRGWRIPEKTLFITAALGGEPGGHPGDAALPPQDPALVLQAGDARHSGRADPPGSGGVLVGDIWWVTLLYLRGTRSERLQSLRLA